MAFGVIHQPRDMMTDHRVADGGEGCGRHEVKDDHWTLPRPNPPIHMADGYILLDLGSCRDVAIEETTTTNKVIILGQKSIVVMIQSQA